jgi:hypothetical protein
VLKKLFDILLDAGVQADTPPHLLVNLRTASIVNIILILAISAFSVLFWAVAPALVPIILTTLIIMFMGVGLQILGYHIASRMTTCTLICALALVIHNCVASQTGGPLPKIYSTCALLALSPFFLFATSELLFATISFLINITLLILAPEFILFFKLKGDVSAIAHPAIQIPILLSGVLLLSASTISLQYVSRREARKADELLKKVEHDNVLASEKESQLHELVNQLKKSHSEEQKRIWAGKGVSEAARILREETEPEKISNKLISYLVKYLECNQGAIFLIDTIAEEQFFSLTGCYAYDRKKFVDKKISLGEGLLGECYFDKNYIHLTQVPKNYTHITSGLGEATPRSILIVPLIANETMYGAFEFASFSTFQKYQIDFLLEIGETTAMTFNAIRTNEHTRLLLQETQTMAEQMKAQEEEMRQNMEELAATQEQQARMEQQLRDSLQQSEEQILKLATKLSFYKDQFSTENINA